MHASMKNTLAVWLIAGAPLVCGPAPVHAAGASGFVMDQIASRFGLTPEQRRIAERVVERWGHEREAAAGASLREEFMREFASDRLDADALARKARERLQQFEAAIPALAADVAALHRALTPNQRAQLTQWMKERGAHRGRHAAAWRRER